MPNWYRKLKEDRRQFSRYTAEVIADIKIPTSDNKEDEMLRARDALDKFLPQSGWVDEAEGSNIQLRVLRIEPYVKLV